MPSARGSVSVPVSGETISITAAAVAASLPGKHRIDNINPGPVVQWFTRLLRRSGKVHSAEIAPMPGPPPSGDPLRPSGMCLRIESDGLGPGEPLFVAEDSSPPIPLPVDPARAAFPGVVGLLRAGEVRLVGTVEEAMGGTGAALKALGTRFFDDPEQNSTTLRLGSPPEPRGVSLVAGALPEMVDPNAVPAILALALASREGVVVNFTDTYHPTRNWAWLAEAAGFVPPAFSPPVHVLQGGQAPTGGEVDIGADFRAFMFLLAAAAAPGRQSDLVVHHEPGLLAKGAFTSDLLALGVPMSVASSVAETQVPPGATRDQIAAALRR